jgi:hypothetical protein
MELREVQAPECDVESVLNFAQYVMLNAARSLTEFGSEQRRRFWQLLCPRNQERESLKPP